MTKNKKLIETRKELKRREEDSKMNRFEKIRRNYAIAEETFKLRKFNPREIKTFILEAKYKELRRIEDLTPYIEAFILTDNFIEIETLDMFEKVSIVRGIYSEDELSDEKLLNITNEMVSLYVATAITIMQEDYKEQWVLNIVYGLRNYEMTEESFKKLQLLTDMVVPKEYQQLLEICNMLLTHEPEYCISKLEEMGIYN